LPGSGSGACWLVPCSPRSPPLAPPTPAPVARCRSPASQLLWRGLTSRPRASPASAHHLPDAGQALLVLAGGEISRFPCKELTHMLGSTTAPGRLGARAGAPSRVAFHSTHSVGVPRVLFYRGRNVDCSTPPAQIRACPIKALGSYLECMTRNRRSGHGCCTRTGGKNRSMSRLIRAHVSRCRWLRRRRLRTHPSLMWARNADSM
jgi:hypothetical protein